MRQAVEDYLALRRSFGYSLERQAQLLTGFAGHLDAAGATHITVEAALGWATLPGDSDPIWYWQRLSAVRGLAAYLHTFDPRHQVPPADLLPRRCHRPPVYMFTTADIDALMAAAAALRPALHAATLQTLIGLLVVTGLRPGEARALHRGDIDYDTAVLTVTNSKYGNYAEGAVMPSPVTVGVACG